MFLFTKVPFPFCVPVDKTVVMASLEEELTCSVCRDVFSQAQPLPCGHSFCPACVRDAWGHGEAGVRGRFTCAQCQEEQGVVACDCCPPVGDGDQSGNAAAVKTCLRCEVSLCAEHLKPHLERPAFKTHLLVEPLGDLSHRRCPAHEEMFRYYCADERVYVCSECLLEGGHAQHRIKGLRKVEEDLKVSKQPVVPYSWCYSVAITVLNPCVSTGHPQEPSPESR